MPRRMLFDGWLFFTTGLLVVGGLFMVGSASHYVAMSMGLDPYHFNSTHSSYVDTLRERAKNREVRPPR